jgi:bacillithiol synthase
MKTAYSFSEIGVKQVALSLYLGEKTAHNFYPPIRPIAECVKHKIPGIANNPQCCRGQRQRVAAMLKRQQPFPNEPAVLKALEAASTDGFFLISGQQVGVCLGPLYSLIKAVALIALRDKLETELPGYRFVPLFWASGMDHDFEEIRHAGYISENGEFCKVSIDQPAGTEGWPASHIKLDSAAVANLRELSSHLPATPYADEMRAAFDASYTPGATLSEAFCRLLASFMAREGLLVFDPEDEEAKKIALPLFTQSLKRQDEEWREINARNAAIQKAGGILQVSTLPEDTNLFMINDSGMREKLVRTDSSFAVKSGGQGWSLTELISLVESEPSRISFSALTRPLFQQTLFPTVAFLGGAGEVAYWAQLYPLFPLYDLPEPLLVPRPTFTLTNSRQRRLMERYGIELPDLLQPKNELMRKLAKDAVPQEITTRIDDMEASFSSQASLLSEDAAKLDAGLVAVMETLNANFQKHLATVKKKVEQSVKQRDGALELQVSELYNSLVPNGALQERSISSLAALVMYGKPLIAAIKSACEFPPAGHIILPL